MSDQEARPAPSETDQRRPAPANASLMTRAEVGRSAQFFSGHISGAERQPNGNVLMCEGASGRVSEVTIQRGTPISIACTSCDAHKAQGTGFTAAPQTCRPIAGSPARNRRRRDHRRLHLRADYLRPLADDRPRAERRRGARGEPRRFRGAADRRARPVLTNRRSCYRLRTIDRQVRGARLKGGGHLLRRYTDRCYASSAVSS
jgi:hypothetical protein